MKILKKFAALALSVVTIFSTVGCSDSQTGLAAKSLELEKEVTVKVWYNDDAYTKYLDYVAKQFNVTNELVTIEPELISESNYIQYIYDQSIRNDNACDVYLCSSDSVEEAYLLGLMLENNEYDKIYTEDIYGKAGLESSSYNNVLYGYPVTYETSALVYNKVYADAVTSFDEIPASDLSGLKTTDNLAMTFAYDASGLLTNYPFASKYISFEGDSMDTANIYINNEEALKKALTEYQGLKEEYGLSTDEDKLNEYQSLFTEGRVAYSIMTASQIENLDTSVKYGVCAIPSLGDGLESQALSTTTMAVVNPYSKEYDVARAVAKAISYDYASNVTLLSNLACARGDVSKDSVIKSLHKIYSESIVKPKYAGIDEIYAQYEIMLHKIWNGESVDTAYDTFAKVVEKYTK
ncbi:sugar ABC transporter substrate-binding protein [Lachnospira pectinoschiza]|uniref:Maltose-binding protein MalE n=1 Tax=Lachnospira pectinoschiza TaxID=28052 RepID=A0A1G9YE12_9FIRM|nr:extracellular solute-binding protein [Lachnospira pectinoschiza]SDN06711.1 Maltose-binding protein MalE [Lachnospira pectinoschiza]